MNTDYNKREPPMDRIRKLNSGKYRLYSRKRTSRTGTRRNWELSIREWQPNGTSEPSNT